MEDTSYTVSRFQWVDMVAEVEIGPLCILCPCVCVCVYHVVVKTSSVKRRTFGPKCPSLVAKCTDEINWFEANQWSCLKIFIFICVDVDGPFEHKSFGGLVQEARCFTPKGLLPAANGATSLVASCSLTPTMGPRSDSGKYKYKCFLSHCRDGEVHWYGVRWPQLQGFRHCWSLLWICRLASSSRMQHTQFLLIAV